MIAVWCFLKFRIACPGTCFDKRVALLDPVWRSFFQCKQRPEKTARSSVLVKSSHKVCHRRFKFVLETDRSVNDQIARSLADLIRLSIGHSFQHFKFDLSLRSTFFAQQHCIGDVEQIVTGDTNSQKIGTFFLRRVLKHPFVIGVDIGFGVIRCLRPIVQTRLNLFHRQVRSFDQSNLDAGAGAIETLPGPVAQSFQHSK